MASRHSYPGSLRLVVAGFVTIWIALTAAGSVGATPFLVDFSATLSGDDSGTVMGTLGVYEVTGFPETIPINAIDIELVALDFTEPAINGTFTAWSAVDVSIQFISPTSLSLAGPGQLISGEISCEGGISVCRWATGPPNLNTFVGYETFNLTTGISKNPANGVLTLAATAVPEPGTALLLASGLLGLAWQTRRLR